MSTLYRETAIQVWPVRAGDTFECCPIRFSGTVDLDRVNTTAVDYTFDFVEKGVDSRG
jgi:hypothetical protein